MLTTETRTVAAGLVRHADGNLDITKLDTMFGTPILTEMKGRAGTEVFGGMPTSYSLPGHEAAADDLFESFRKAGVLEHPEPRSGNLMAPPYASVDEGQSALIAETFGDGGPVSHLLVFPTDAPPTGIKDALAALDGIVATAHAKGPDPTGGAAGGFL